MRRGTPQTEGAAVPDDTRLLAILTESTDDALWMFTPDWGELLFVNSAYEEIFGGTVENLAESPREFLDRTHPEDRERVTEAMETLSAGSPVNVEFRVDPGKDYETWVWVQGQPVYDESDEMEGVVGYTRDITERKRYQQKLERKQTELERANQSLREFAYIASHDLQEPLRMVSSYVDLLEEEYGDQLEDEAQEYMDFAVDGARRMKRMIDSLLEYSRVHTEADEFEETDAAAVVADVRHDLELFVDDHDAEVTVGDLPTVEADRDQLGQVFLNLVKNAVEHADGDSPRVEVTATEREDAVEFAVADNGPGIPESEREDIFEIFSRGSNASDGNSTGIGLAVAQRIVHRHGGEIWVESTLGEGATFKFTIPKSGGDLTEVGVA